MNTLCSNRMPSAIPPVPTGETTYSFVLHQGNGEDTQQQKAVSLCNAVQPGSRLDLVLPYAGHTLQQQLTMSVPLVANSMYNRFLCCAALSQCWTRCAVTPSSSSSLDPCLGWTKHTSAATEKPPIQHHWTAVSVCASLHRLVFAPARTDAYAPGEGRT